MEAFANDLNFPEDAAYWASVAERLQKGVNRYLWHSEKEAFMDRWVDTGEQTQLISIAGFLPIAADMVPEVRGFFWFVYGLQPGR